jgi:hypothetical protein
MLKIKVIKKFLFSVFLFSVFHLLSCGVQAQSEWAKLKYHFNSGSLPPPYHYSYTISVNIDGKGELVYISGYQEKDKTNIGHPFELNNEKLEALKNAVKESDILNLDIKSRPSGEIPDGGHSESLEFYVYKDDNNELTLIKSIVTYPELKYEGLLDKLYKVIQNSVPEDIWNEVKSKNVNK